MHAYANKHASPRASGRTQRNVIILPIRKTPEWWEKSALELTECADEHLATFDEICNALRDEKQNPEWRYVVEGS